MAKRNYCYIDFREEPVAPQFTKVATAAATSVDAAAAAATGYLRTQDNYHLEVYHADPDANATAINFIPTADGWTLPIDGQDAAGVEITRGVNTWNSPAFTIGTSPAFFFKATFKVTTLANIDNLFVGFRRAGSGSNTGAYGAYVGEVANLATIWTDFAYIGIVDGAGAFGTSTELNNGGAVNTTLAHAAHVTTEFVQFLVNVSAAGVVTYQLGTAATVAGITLAADASAVAYTFDSTDVVIPSIVCGGTAAGAPNVQLVHFEHGYQTL